MHFFLQALFSLLACGVFAKESADEHERDLHVLYQICRIFLSSVSAWSLRDTGSTGVFFEHMSHMSHLPNSFLEITRNLFS